MVDAVRPRFSIAAFVAQTKAEAAANPGIQITPRVSGNQTAVERASIKASNAGASERVAEARGLARSSRASKPLDVSTLRPDQAGATLAQLQLMNKLGGIKHMGINVTNGDQRTNSLETFMEWLGERAAQNGDMNSSAPVSPTAQVIDFKV